MKGLSRIEKVVLYERYKEERMAEVFKLNAIAFASFDNKEKAQESIMQFIEHIFPEYAGSRARSLEDRMSELNEFTQKRVSLSVHGDDHASLNIEDITSA